MQCIVWLNKWFSTCNTILFIQISILFNKIIDKKARASFHCLSCRRKYQFISKLLKYVVNKHVKIINNLISRHRELMRSMRLISPLLELNFQSQKVLSTRTMSERLLAQNHYKAVFHVKQIKYTLPKNNVSCLSTYCNVALFYPKTREFIIAQQFLI